MMVAGIPKTVTQGQVAVGVASVNGCSRNVRRHKVTIQAHPSNTGIIYGHLCDPATLNEAATVANAAFALAAGQAWTEDGSAGVAFNGQITLISDVAAQAAHVNEY